MHCSTSKPSFYSTHNRPTDDDSLHLHTSGKLSSNKHGRSLCVASMMTDLFQQKKFGYYVSNLAEARFSFFYHAVTIMTVIVSSFLPANFCLMFVAFLKAPTWSTINHCQLHLQDKVLGARISFMRKLCLNVGFYPVSIAVGLFEKPIQQFICLHSKRVTGLCVECL